MSAARLVRNGRAIGTPMIRVLLASDAHRDAAVYLAQTSATGPPWLAIALAVIATLSAVGVASAPALVERAKRGKATPSAAAVAAPTVDGSVDLVRKALDDAWRERDGAQGEAKEAARQLTAAHRVIAERDVEIARLTGRIDALIDRLGKGPA